MLWREEKGDGRCSCCLAKARLEEYRAPHVVILLCRRCKAYLERALRESEALR